MMEFVIKAGLAGVFFGIWPLVMQRSGLQGNASSMIFAGVAFLAVAPFALSGGLTSFRGGSFQIAILSGVLGGVGLLFLNSMLSKVPIGKVGSMMAVMIMVQLIIPMLYQFVSTGEHSTKQIGGVIAAIAAILLLV